MSGGRKGGAGQRIAQLLALLVVSGVMFGATRAVTPSEGTSGVLTAMGFLLLAGMLASGLLELVGLPHLTGYLLAGALAGPYVFRLVDHHAVQRLEPVNTLALSLIALAGGAQLRIDLLKQVLRSLVSAIPLQCGFGMLFNAVAFVAITRFLPFTAGLGLSCRLGIGLLWGTLAVCHSPSATLGIFSQLRPDGPVSRFSLALVISSDVLAAVLLTVAIALARPLVDPGAGLSLAAFRDLAREVLGSISLGTTLGLLLAAYLWLIGGGLLLVLIALGFGLTEGLHYLRFDPLLAFMIAGFVVANFSEQGPKLLAAVDRTGNVVYVVFFATAGAHLNLDLVRELWPIAVYLGVARVCVIWGAHRLSTRLSREDPPVRNWGWASLVSQAGLTIGMTVVIERTFPSFGSEFRSLAIASVALNELAGPVLFKFALDRTGESGKGIQEEAFHAAEGGPLPPAELA